MNKLNLRYQTLAKLKANESEIEELLAYNENRFQQNYPKSIISFPLKSEPHLEIWENYKSEADNFGTYASLKSRLVQLQFPIMAGISQTEEYRSVTRKGKMPLKSGLATGLQLTAPEKLQLQIKNTLAGSIPVIIAPNREDFVLLIQALTKRNEPIAIPDSMGACIVGGYNNWDRIQRYRQHWEINNPEHCSEKDWHEEFKSLIPHKQLYQDRFILLSQGFYSNVSASQLNLSDSQWQKLSLTIRLEHECTHYFTRRVFNSMRNNLFDELIADYQGIVAALGYFRADWLLIFLGLESFPHYRKGGRLENYRGDPPLSSGAFKILQHLVKIAAENLEQFGQKYFPQNQNKSENISLLMALTTLTLEELASSEVNNLLEASISLQKNIFNLEYSELI